MENLKMPIVEYLDPTNDYKFHQFKLGSQLLPDGWIRVPEGAVLATLSSHSDQVTFWKDEKHCWNENQGGWMDTVPYADAVGRDIYYKHWKHKTVWQRDQADAVASLNDIAKTAEAHRENKLSNDLNDLCAEFGCPPGADRMRWLRDRLRGTRNPETLYHYSASINTARGTVAYDGVITMPERITGIEDYQKARTEIAKDGNVAPEQVNVHSLSIVN